MSEAIGMWGGDVESYVVSIKDYTRDELVDERVKNLRMRGKIVHESVAWIDSEYISELKKDALSESVESLIARAMEDRFYVFDDDYEHKENTEEVKRILSDFNK